MFAVMAVVLGGVVASIPAGAVVDRAVVVPSPNVGADDNYLNSVSCVSASECVAVGYRNTDPGTGTLVMVWDGIEWSIVPSPNAGTINNYLNSVSCVSASECVAVGSTYTGDYLYETLVMVWDGTAWSIVPSPNAGTINDQLDSVSCVSASECVAVGQTRTGSVFETLAMVWDGTVWSIVPSPNPGTRYDQLDSVSCVSASECVAVGSTQIGFPIETLVLVWDGNEWSIVPSPNAGTINDQLDSVSCVSASDCVAVGSTQTEDSMYETLAMVWDGIEWSIVPSPNPGTIDDGLFSVSCVSASDCVAVGRTDIGDYLYETLVMVWDGIEWLIVPSPNAGTINDQLDSVSCVSGSDCVAVGSTYNGSDTETLVLSMTGPVPPSTTTTLSPPDQVVPAFTG
jgi:hypothetical protein